MILSKSITEPCMHLLIIGYVWPEPKSSAAGCRMLSLIELFLAQGWRVTFASPAALGAHHVDLPGMGVAQVEIALNDSRFDAFVHEAAPDVVMFDRFMMEEQFGWRVAQQCPEALRVLDTEDLHFLRNARHQAHKQGRALCDEDLFAEAAQREVAAIYRCDMTLLISEAERDLLVERFAVPPALLHYLPLLVEEVRAEHDGPGFEQRADFLTIGNFRHAPNWDAVLWLKQAIWPLIRKRLPQAQLRIYGAYPPPKATALHNAKQGFHVMGWAEDVYEVMRAARVCLAPLRFGAGQKGKLVDAMLCGTPSVTTAIGAEGMAGDLTWPGLLAESPEEIAEAAVRLYEDAALWEEKRRQGFEVLAARFAAKLFQADFLQRLAHLRENLKAHRLANFTGAMLQHHQHKSTQYMSQWIEAKNRLAAAQAADDGD